MLFIWGPPFFEEGYRFDGVVGTSIGAINGAVIAQGDFEKGYNWWTKIDISTIFDIEKSHIQKFMNRNIDRKTLAYILSTIISRAYTDTFYSCI